MIIGINESDNDHIVVDGQDNEYQIGEDEVTGDWVVTSYDDEQVQGDWMKTRDDAIKYALERGGVIEDTNYQRAPNRT